MIKAILVILTLVLASSFVIASHPDIDTFTTYKQFKVDLENNELTEWNRCQIENNWGYIDALSKHKCLLDIYYIGQDE